MFCGMSSDSPVSFSLSRGFMDTSRSTSLSECFLDPAMIVTWKLQYGMFLDCLVKIRAGADSPALDLLSKFNIFIRYFSLITHTHAETGRVSIRITMTRVRTLKSKKITRVHCVID